jgi:phosphoribosylanthranilate isomerase
MSAPLWIKVCGLRTAQAIEAAAAAGADAVGFVFHAASPRHLDVAAASELASGVPRGMEKVAVFLHPSQALVDAAVEAIGPGWVQTDAEDFAMLTLGPGQKPLPVHRTRRTVAPRTVSPAGRFLVESARSGAGEVADWRAAALLASHGELVLAGGLTTANVGEAIAVVRPFGIDVSSGVESSRGVKDARMILEFVSAARAAHRRLASSAME